MKNKPLVTVVTITFNLKKAGREKHFKQCLESVHKQTYKNIEHLIIDGASTDGTVDLLKEYEKKGWIRYISESDRGIYDALNKSLKIAKGKYISFLHSDDYYHNPQAVELSVTALEKESADYSFANTIGINVKNDKPVHNWYGNLNLIPFGTHYCHQSMFIRTDLLRETGGFNTEYKISADSYLMISLVEENKKSVYIPEFIVSYRSGGMSNKHIAETRKEHSGAFYELIGKNEGLTRDECFSLWNFSLLREQNFFYCLRMIDKLKRDEWRKELSRRLFSFGGIKKQVVRLFPEKIKGPVRRLYRGLRERF